MEHNDARPAFNAVKRRCMLARELHGDGDDGITAVTKQYIMLKVDIFDITDAINGYFEHSYLILVECPCCTDNEAEDKLSTLTHRSEAAI